MDVFGHEAAQKDLAEAKLLALLEAGELTVSEYSRQLKQLQGWQSPEEARARQEHTAAMLQEYRVWLYLGLALLVLIVFFLARVRYVIQSRGPLPRWRTTPVNTLIVLGSGGHTAEMLKLLDSMNKSRYQPRCYVVAETDAMSGAKALAKEREWQGTENPSGFKVLQIPRSREVGQSYITSIGTTLRSQLSAVKMVLAERPELVLVNGPGTCIPICAAAFLFRILSIMRTQVVYVESIARTRKFSLSAKLLYYLRMTDVLIVQWEQLRKTYPRAVYGGRLY